MNVDVVRVVAERVDPLSTAARDVTFVGFDGLGIRVVRVLVTAEAHVDMRRHVHEMAGLWRESGEQLRRGLRPFRVVGLHQVNVVMDCAGVLGIALDHSLENGEDFRRILPR